MALFSTDQLAAQWRGLNHLGALRQVGLIIGLAAAIALAVGAVLWSQQPSYRLLLQGVSGAEMAEVTQALSRSGIDYRIDPGGTRILVPAGDVARARMQLATADLPAKPPTGYEILDQDTGFGASRMMEAIRHRRALEGELARTIASISGVQSARVHLALPDPSAFLRDQQQPSASVVAHLGSAARLDGKQVDGIVNLVANSVPQLDPARVSVVDEQGRLLSDNGADPALEQASAYQRLTRQLESEYVARIRDILAPLVGRSGVRAQVNASVDYTRTETTREDYDPQQSAVRSERVVEDGVTERTARGVPGALSNQPPGAGEAAAEGEGGGEDDGANAQGAEAAASGARTSREVVRNFEIDRTLEHSRPVPGRIERLSVAVMLDHAPQRNTEGQVERVALAPEELERARDLVRQAVGFNAERGDTLSLSHSPFRREADPVAEAPATPLWEQPRLWAWLRDLVGGLAIIVLALFVLRPALKGLASTGTTGAQALPSAGDDAAGLPPAAGADAQSEQTYEQRLSEARGLAQQDPQRTARIAREWLNGANA
jgi:flagellar M-ring protein FliF